MLVYSIGCILSVIFTGIALRIKHKKEDVKYWLILSTFSSFPLMIVASVRYNVGQDYLSYVRLFNQAANGYRQPGLEIAFHELNRLVYHLGGNYIWIFVICSIVFCIFTYMCILRVSPSPSLSVYLLVTTTYYFIFLNGMRQMVGCAILLFSLQFVNKRKLPQFLLCVLLASCFHYSCVIFVFVYFIYNLSIKRSTVFFATIIVFLLSSPIAEIVKSIASITYYGGYIGGHFDTSERGYIGFAINIVLVVFATAYYRDDAEYKLYYNLNIIALWLSVLVGKVVLINRVRWMFGFTSILLIPMALSNISDKKTRFFVGMAIVVLYGLYFYYTIGINNSSNVLPYQTIFSR